MKCYNTECGAYHKNDCSSYKYDDKTIINCPKYKSEVVMEKESKPLLTEYYAKELYYLAKEANDVDVYLKDITNYGYIKRPLSEELLEKAMNKILCPINIEKHNTSYYVKDEVETKIIILYQVIEQLKKEMGEK